MRIRSLLIKIPTALFVVTILPALQEWFVELARSLDLYDDPGGKVDQMIGLLGAMYEHQAYWPVVALIAGFAIGTWSYWLVGRLTKKDDGWERVYADIPTSIKIQFEHGSEKARQLENRNIRNFYGERAQFNFLGDDGKPVMPSAVIWYVFLTFKEPTSYGQIIVEAGNAEIPRYQVSHSSYWGAVLRFEGEIGNVSLEIKCAPPNADQS